MFPNRKEIFLFAEPFPVNLRIGGFVDALVEQSVASVGPKQGGEESVEKEIEEAQSEVNPEIGEDLEDDPRQAKGKIEGDVPQEPAQKETPGVEEALGNGGRIKGALRQKEGKGKAQKEGQAIKEAR